MRALLYTVALIASVECQFSLFSSQPAGNEYYDQFGMKNAIGVWSDAIRKIALRNNPKFYQESNVRQFTLEPPTVNPQELDLKKLKKGKGDQIINEKLLNLLLPRIKGQNQLTTTTKKTTTKITTTTPLTTTTTATTTTTTTTTTAEPTTTEQMTTIPIETTTEIVKKEVPGRLVQPENDSGETETHEAKKKSEKVDFTTDEKNISHEIEDVAKSTEENKISTSTTSTTTTSVENKKDNEDNEKKSEDKKLSVKFHTMEEVESTNTKSDNNGDAKNTTENSETTTMDEDDKPSYIKKLEEIYKKEEELVERELAELSVAEIFESKQTSTKSTSEPSTTESSTTEASTTTELSTTREVPSTTTTEVATTTETTTTSTTESPETTTEQASTTSLEPTTPLITTTSTDNPLAKEEELEKEAMEVLKSLDQEEEDDKRKHEEVQKRKDEREDARKRINKFLGTMKKIREARKMKTTTTAVNESTNEETTTTTEVVEESTTTVPITTRKPSNIPEAEDEEEESSTTTTTSEPLSTTEESEDADENDSSEVQTKEMTPEDLEKSNSTTTEDDENEEANSPSPFVTLPTLTAPQLAQVMTPVAGILDDIKPILSTLLAGSASQSAKARAASVRTYQTNPSGNTRDIMADGYSENSLVGFGSQIAREILNPGTLRRDKIERERALAAKIEEARKRNAAAAIESLATGAPLDLTAYQQYQAISQQQKLPGKENLPYFVPPPPGYVGPLPPVPPPPSFAMHKESQTPVNMQTKTTTAPRPLPTVPTTQRTPNPNDKGYEQGRSDVQTNFFGDSGVMLGGKKTIPTSDFESMPSETFGLAPAEPLPEAPPPQAKPPPPPPASFGGGKSFGNSRGGGFGGGTGPSLPFEEVASNSKPDFSFFSSSRKKM